MCSSFYCHSTKVHSAIHSFILFVQSAEVSVCQKVYPNTQSSHLHAEGKSVCVCVCSRASVCVFIGDVV